MKRLSDISRYDVCQLPDIDVLQNKTKEELIEIILDVRYQFRNKYTYIVGEWKDVKRAKETKSGKFVAKAALIEYLAD